MVFEDPPNPNHSMSLSSQECVFSQSLSPWSNVKRRTIKGWFSWLVFLGWFLYFFSCLVPGFWPQAQPEPSWPKPSENNQSNLEGCSWTMLGPGKPSSIPQAGRKKKVGKKLYISHKNLGVNSSQRFQAQNPNQNWAITHIFFFVEPKAVPVRLYICSLINIGDFVFSRKRTGEADSSMWSIWQRVSFMLLVGSSGYICKL